jgi:hypothetical protein
MLKRLDSSEFGVSSLEILPGQPGNHDPLIQKKLGIKDAQLARRMYDDDAPYILPGGRLSPDAMKEIVEIGREALKIKEPRTADRIFDFSLASEPFK